ncbi:MAG TPA: PA2169 family four-helix-bundle protein [Blastocatellia bacterium]|nr:PA2169 family four-helix-bundle protein [Blastocatellia bacterium]
MQNDNVIDCLHDLIEACRDGQNGFNEAAENVKGSDLKTLFRDVSLQRAQFAAELQREVRALGGNPEEKGSAVGLAHRVWIDIKGTLTGKDDKNILSEAERGEDSAIKSYENALGQPLPTKVRAIVERQYSQVKAVHDRVKMMRDARTAGAGRR